MLSCFLTVSNVRLDDKVSGQKFLACVASPKEMWLHDIKSSFPKIGWRIGKEHCQYSMSPELSTGLITHTRNPR